MREFDELACPHPQLQLRLPVPIPKPYPYPSPYPSPSPSASIFPVQAAFKSHLSPTSPIQTSHSLGHDECGVSWVGVFMGSLLISWPPHPPYAP